MGTTKYSEQSHVPNHDSKEKEFKLKENSKIQSQDLLLLNRSQNRPSRSCWLCGLSARSPGDLPSSSLRQEWATAPSGHARALPIPNFAKNVSSWGAARHVRAGFCCCRASCTSSSYDVRFSQRIHLYPRMMRAASVLAWTWILAFR